MKTECKKGMGTASVSLAVFGVPPNTFSPKQRWEVRRETPRTATGTVALPFHPVKPASNRRSKSPHPNNPYKQRKMNHLQTNASKPVKLSQSESNHFLNLGDGGAKNIIRRAA
jgi:hypothetical protein